jgi:hypothetical protein
MPQDKLRINRLLRELSLGTLDEPGELVPVLASLVDGHAHFAQLIATCEPEQRSAMYDSMKPYLPFEANSLDWYIARAKEKAERLPTLDQKTGELNYPQPAEVQTVQRVVEETLMSGRLHLTCRKCTKTETFVAAKERMIDAIEKAREKGWLYDPVEKFEMCPECTEVYAPGWAKETVH